MNLNVGFVSNITNPVIFKGLAYGNGVYVGVGDSGQVGSSPDGTTWTIHASNTKQNLTAVAYFGQFIAVGQGGVMITSPDGITWTTVTSPTSRDLNAVYPADGTFFAAGSTGLIEESGLLQMTYSQWLSTHFLSSQLSNPAITAPGATPQNDGIVNQLKYIFDIDPSATMKASDRAALPAVGMITSAGNEYLTLTYRENPTYSGSTVSLQYSADLKTWQTTVPAFDVIVGTDPSTGDPLVEQGVNVTGTSKGFLRLNVTSP